MAFEIELEGDCDVEQLPASADGRSVLITPDSGETITLHKWCCTVLAAELVQQATRTVDMPDNRKIHCVGPIKIKIELGE